MYISISTHIHVYFCLPLLLHTTGLPPATASVPGKKIIARMYEIFCQQKNKKEEEEEKEEEEKEVASETMEKEKLLKKKQQFEQWKDMSELLSNAIELLFSKASMLGGM